jgi:hypothetical protein
LDLRRRRSKAQSREIDGRSGFWVREEEFFTPDGFA